MLKLTNELFINEGAMRRCYLHPEDRSRCVKVYRPQADIDQLAKKWRVWLGQRWARFNINHQEYAFWRQLIEDPGYGDLIHEYVPHMSGVVDTDQGPGLVQQLLTNDDGTPAEHLRMLGDGLSRDALTDIGSQLRRLVDCVVENAIPIYDWNPSNILLVKQGNRYLVKIADLEGEIGNKEFIKVSRYSVRARRRKLKRRTLKIFVFLEWCLSTHSSL